jgi:hypothetical protein
VGLTGFSGLSVSGSPITSSGTLALSTTLSGILKGTGSAFTTATSGTDYAPATSGSSPLKGNGAGGFSAAAAADIYGLWSGTCSSSTFLRGDGSCQAPAGSGTVNSGTANYLAYYSSTGTAVSGTSAIPNGITATTQSAGDNSTKVATTAYVNGAITTALGVPQDIAAAASCTISSGINIAYTSASLTAARACTMPAASAYSAGTVVSVQDQAGGVTSTNTLSLARAGTDTINGSTSNLLAINTAYHSVACASNGSNAWTCDPLLIPNVMLANSSMTIAGTSVSLGGSITQDTITGLSSTGLVKRSGANTLATAVAADVYGLWSGTCSSSTYLRGDGSCQTPAGSGGTVTSVGVSAFTGITVSGSPVTGSGTIALSTTLSGILKGNGTGFTTATSGTDYAPATSGSVPLKGNGSGGFSSAVAADIYGLWSGTCSASTFLRGDGSCQTPAGSGGTVTSIATTSPITGGTITGSGTIACATCTTSAASLTAHGVVVGGGSQAEATIAVLSSDNVLLGSTGADPGGAALPSCTDTSGNHLNYNTSTHAFSCGTSSSGGSTAFSAITTATNTTATMTVGSGGTLTFTGSGTLAANYLNNVSVPAASVGDAIFGISVFNSGQWETLPNCADSSGNHMNYSTSSHAWTCGTTTSGVTASGNNTFTAGQAVTPTTLSISTATFTPTFATSNNFNITLVHASCPCTIANPTGVIAGQSGTLVINQSSSGSDTIGTWGSNYKFAGATAPTLSTGASAVDVFGWYAIDTTHIVIGAGLLNVH